VELSTSQILNALVGLGLSPFCDTIFQCCSKK